MKWRNQDLLISAMVGGAVGITFSAGALLLLQFWGII